MDVAGSCCCCYGWWWGGIFLLRFLFGCVWVHVVTAFRLFVGLFVGCGADWCELLFVSFFVVCVAWVLLQCVHVCFNMRQCEN
jgi:hypothetical protein